MTLLGVLRITSLPTRRRRATATTDFNADRTAMRSTGDPRLDLARMVQQASVR